MRFFIYVLAVAWASCFVFDYFCLKHMSTHTKDTKGHNSRFQRSRFLFLFSFFFFLLTWGQHVHRGRGKERRDVHPSYARSHFVLVYFFSGFHFVCPRICCFPCDEEEEWNDRSCGVNYRRV
jgi:hypothetical protein